MFALVPDSVVLSLFDNPDDLADYCVADTEQKNAILEKVIARLTKEGKSIPGMACTLPRH